AASSFARFIATCLSGHDDWPSVWGDRSPGRATASRSRPPARLEYAGQLSGENGSWKHALAPGLRSPCLRLLVDVGDEGDGADPVERADGADGGDGIERARAEVDDGEAHAACLERLAEGRLRGRKDHADADLRGGI